MNIQLICEIKYHKEQITHILILKDNRICTSSYDNSIIVYNSHTYTKDIIINEHDDWVSYLYQLYSDNIMSASYDGTLKIFKINKQSYKVVNIINFKEDAIIKLIELKNEEIVFLTGNKKICFYIYENKIYKQNYIINESIMYDDILELNKYNLIVLSSNSNNIILFFNYITKKTIKKLFLESLIFSQQNILNFNQYLIVFGFKLIYIIDIKQYKLIKTIKNDFSVTCSIKKDNENFIIGDNIGFLRLFNYNYKIQNIKELKNIYVKDEMNSIEYNKKFNNILINNNKNISLKIYNLLK
jgi:WD40 repeat protein